MAQDDDPKKQPRPRKRRQPRGPDGAARAWRPPGQRKDAPPAEVPAAVRNDDRQLPLGDWPEQPGGLTP
jgi:hypothetical protein